MRTNTCTLKKWCAWHFSSRASKLLASLGYTGRRVVLGHTLNTQTLTKTDEQKKVLSQFTILCWAPFIATLGHMWPTGCGLDTPAMVFEIRSPTSIFKLIY